MSLLRYKNTLISLIPIKPHRAWMSFHYGLFFGSVIRPNKAITEIKNLKVYYKLSRGRCDV